MRRRAGVCIPTTPRGHHYGVVGPLRTIVGVLRRRRPDGGPDAAPALFWGRVGPYEAVTRRGTLYLLAPDAVHPARRVRESA